MGVCNTFHVGTTETIIRSLLNEGEWNAPSSVKPGEHFTFELTVGEKAYRGTAILSAFGDVAKVLSLEDGSDTCVGNSITGLDAANHDLIISDAYWRSKVAAVHQKVARPFISQDQLTAYKAAEQRYNINRSVSCPVAFAFTGPLEDHPSGGGGDSVALGLIDVKDFHVLKSTYASRIGELPFDFSSSIPLHSSTIDKLKLKSTGKTKVKFWPTSSVRTMMAEDGSVHVKSSYPYTLSSRQRLIVTGEAKSAIYTTNALVSLIDKGAWPYNWHILPELYAFYHKSQDDMGIIVRGGLAHIYPKVAADDWVVPAFALTNTAPNGQPSIVQELCAEFGWDPKEWFERTCRLLLNGATELIYKGVSHESHGQNTLFVISGQTGQVEGICLRDLESTKLDAKKLKKLGIEIEHENTHKYSLPVLPVELELRRSIVSGMFYHGIMDSVLEPLVRRVALDFNLDEAELRGMASVILTRAVLTQEAIYKEKLIERHFLRRNLFQRSLGISMTTTPYRRTRLNPYPIQG
jgi:hypothetical protein